MREIKRFELNPLYGRLGSLLWREDDLVDWVGGGRRYRLDGTIEEGRGAGGYRFDEAACHPAKDYQVIYERAGTKGLLLRGGRIIREINRSFYHADDYEYPVALFDWVDGRAVIAHCPSEYCRIEIEDVESGERLTRRTSKSVDFFYSRLQASPDGKYLLSAGWVWQPWDVAVIFDLKAVAENPELLDNNPLGIGGSQAEETSSAAFINSEKVLFSGPNTDGSEQKEFLGIHDLQSNKTEFEVEIDAAAGAMMPFGEHVVTFCGHPRLREISSGKMLCEWPDIPSGSRATNILRGRTTPEPYLALDPSRKRFAVGTKERITVIELGE